MGQHHRIHRVSNYTVTRAIRLHELAGSDHRGNPSPSSRASGQAHSLNKAPSSSTHRLHAAGHTLPPTAGSDFDLPFLPREHGVPYLKFAKEICHDQSSSA